MVVRGARALCGSMRGKGAVVVCGARALCVSRKC